MNLGTYLDTDVISLQPLPGFSSFLGREYLGDGSTETQKHACHRDNVAEIQPETETGWQREEQIYSDGEPIRLKDKNRLVERDTEKETGWRRHRQI